MEKRNRAYRRHKQTVKFERRLKIWADYQHNQNQSRADFIRIALEENDGWLNKLRSMAVPCSCSCCSPEFIREPKSKVVAKINASLAESADAHGSNPCVAKRESSNLSGGTKQL